MTKTAKDYEDDYTKPKLREKLKEEIKDGDKGGKPGQWSARKSQLLTHEYEEHGGGYKHEGEKTEAQKSLEQWTEEDWQTAEGDAEARQDDGTVKRYLPKKAWDQLSEKEKKDADAKKKAASKDGQQYVDNTDAAKEARKKVKTAHDRGELESMSKSDLNDLAGDFEISGRSSMDKEELIHALMQAAAPGGSSGSSGGGDDEPTKAELYDEAKELDVEGRSKMDKGELEEAVEKAK